MKIYAKRTVKIPECGAMRIIAGSIYTNEIVVNSVPDSRNSAANVEQYFGVGIGSRNWERTTNTTCFCVCVYWILHF